jgi:tetratricopeptide (TPR) repeat protein
MMSLSLPALLVLSVMLAGARPACAEESSDYIHYHLGIKYKNENRYDQALDEFRKLLTAYPDNYNAYMQIAEIRKSQGQPRLVIYNLKKALSYNPGWAKAQKMLADAYEQDRQFQNAIVEFQQYQQICDPSEQDSVQAKINSLLRKVKGEPEPPVQAASAPAALKDTAASKKTASPGQQAKRPAEKPESKKAAAPVQEAAKAPVPKKPASAATGIGNAQSHLGQAVALYNEGKLNEALVHLKKAVMLQRNYGEAYYYGGLIRYKTGQNDMAKINFTKALAFQQDNALPHFYLGKIHGEEKNYKEAIVQLNDFLKGAGGSELKAEAVVLLKQYKAAIGDTSPAPAPVAGTAATAGGAESAAAAQEEAFAPETSLSTLEMRIDSLLTLAVVDTLSDAGQAMLSAVKEFKASRFDESIKSFKKVMVSFPAAIIGPLCTYDIGVCYMKLRLFSSAENQFDQVLDRYPSHALEPKSRFFKAYSYLERGESGRAEKLLLEFLRKHRTHAWAGKAFEKLGDIYVDLRQQSKAIDAYQQASAQAQTAPDRLYALYKLGNAYFEANNAARGIETLKKVIEMGEKNASYIRVPDSYYRIADHQYQQKEYKASLEYYQKATRRYPSYQETPWGLFQIGNIFKNQKNFQKAIDTYKSLAKSYPDDYWAKQAKWKIEDAVWENEYHGVLN